MHPSALAARAPDDLNSAPEAVDALKGLEPYILAVGESSLLGKTPAAAAGFEGRGLFSVSTELYGPWRYLRLLQGSVKYLVYQETGLYQGMRLRCGLGQVFVGSPISDELDRGC